MKVIIGADAKGYALKEHLKNYLTDKGYDVVDKTPEKDLDLFESASRVAKAIQQGEGDRGIAIDEYGAGSFMVATKYKGVICAETSDEHSSKMTRSHNNASMITLGSGIVSERLAEGCADAFIENEYAGGRHQVRVDMLNRMC
ncbi:galactose-6-phosphate isomerase subunit LacA [Sporolactobacillus putidus]|uniref:Galactose-6-phosphate isomerase subunit LacA n=1 Tax=Sporolactobacillus putidus TaxID=492735 RepID=A0A917S812_9BACL|nr:galactose-6-phosphate isomerase subunit LacA [Sporolactobacillus putidus]GGL61578.1 galactose-6-phosphate isomerase subunit LacA [Sporolactobacillus putidus]